MAHSADILSPADATAPNFYRPLAFLLVAAFPALFWTSLLYAAGSALGTVPSIPLLATVATAIAMFLSLVFNALTSPAGR